VRRRSVEIGAGSSGYCLVVHTIVPGLAFLITWPVGASIPEGSTRKVTSVSPCSLAASRDSWPIASAVMSARHFNASSGV
jgi:hypothetical protein